jgi:hypothetical protein
MIETVMPPPTSAKPPPDKAGWGAPVVSVYSLTLLLVALVLAYIMKNENLLVILAGVIATNATTIVGFYVGSSRSSQAKDETISSQLPIPPPTLPLPPHL